jgi:putative transposase
MMCKVFKVSKSGFYTWRGRPPCLRMYENDQLISAIHDIYDKSNGTYGSPRIAAELNKMGFEISRPRVARLMQKENLRSRTKRKYVVTTNSKHDYGYWPNLLDRNFVSNEPGKAWVSDLTYIATTEGWLYLTVVIDLFDRKVIGWSCSRSMTTTETVIPALKMALKNRPRAEGIIFHSDRGVQYADKDFRELLQGHRISQSMSRKANCWDNAVAESFFGSLKKECVYLQASTKWNTTKLILFNYIEIWYNRKRIHSTLGYLTPLEFEHRFYNYKLAA